MCKKCNIVYKVNVSDALDSLRIKFEKYLLCSFRETCGFYIAKEYTLADNIFHCPKFIIKITNLICAIFKFEDNLQLNGIYIL